MAGDGPFDLDGDAGLQAAGLGVGTRRRQGAFGVRSAGAEAIAAADAQARAEGVDGQPEAAKTAPEAAVEIEETQVQSRRRVDMHALALGAGQTADLHVFPLVRMILHGWQQLICLSTLDRPERARRRRRRRL